MVDSIMRFVVLFLWGEGGVSAKWVKCGGLTLILSQEEEFFGHALPRGIAKPEKLANAERQ